MSKGARVLDLAVLAGFFLFFIYLGDSAAGVWRYLVILTVSYYVVEVFMGFFSKLVMSSDRMNLFGLQFVILFVAMVSSAVFADAYSSGIFGGIAHVSTLEGNIIGSFLADSAIGAIVFRIRHNL